MLHGPILTQCGSFDQIVTSVQHGRYNALKIVTGWGSPSSWSPTTINQVKHIVPNVIVRTVAGDPSYAAGTRSFPQAEQVWEEIHPWYIAQPNLYIEIGNEPNISTDWTEGFAWIYAWHLEQTIKMCRHSFPEAKLIAPALLLETNRRPRRWLEIVSNVMCTCDFIGIHAYEYDAFVAQEQHKGSTGQFALAHELYKAFFGTNRWMLTEYGINDPDTPPAVKGKRYAALARRSGTNPILSPQFHGAFYFHFCADGSLFPEYHIAPDGDIAYGNAWHTNQS